jgi:hypothetical protein
MTSVLVSSNSTRMFTFSKVVQRTVLLRVLANNSWRHERAYSRAQDVMSIYLKGWMTASKAKQL